MHSTAIRISRRRALKAKRLFDIIAAFLVLLATVPITVSISILVLITNGWPVIIALNRVGQGGTVFKMYKFRSMIKNAHLKKHAVYGQPGHSRPKRADDPRITAVGRVLRRTSVDELAQLINVIRGDMSLVGPRPEEPAELVNRPKYYKNLQTFRPGLTGLAQIYGRSYLLPWHDRFNGWYVKLWSLKLDFVIMLKTVLVVWRGYGAC